MEKNSRREKCPHCNKPMSLVPNYVNVWRCAKRGCPVKEVRIPPGSHLAEVL